MKYTLAQIKNIIAAAGNITIIDISNTLDALGTEQEENDFDSYDSIQKWNDMQELCTIACSDNANGDDDDYHNLAVTFAKLRLYDCAIKVIDKGLKKYSFSTDLLADKILYGIDGGFLNKSSDAYNRIMKIDIGAWTWRAYSFVINYYIEKAKNYPVGDNFTMYKNKSIELAEAFIRYAERRSHENIDRAYSKKAEVVHFFGFDENEEDILLQGYNKVNLAPMCSLALADKSFKQGKYTETLPYIEKCIIASKKRQPSIDPSYVNLLYALSKTQQLFDDSTIIDYSEHQNEIKEIYKFLHIAIDAYDADKMINKVVKQTIRAISIQTEIEDNINSKTEDYV